MKTREKTFIESPWNAAIEDFLKYCCPECDFKEKNQDGFLQHALDYHPESEKYLKPDDSKEYDFFQVKDNDEFVTLSWK